MEKYSHDPPIKVTTSICKETERDGQERLTVQSTAELGYKDQNSSIHLLEALTELYKAWPDALVKERLQEMLVLIRDKIVTQKGYLQLFFT